MRTRQSRLALLTALAIVSCVTVHGQKISSDCLCIAGGEISVNCDRNTYSMTAMHIAIEPGCAVQMGSISVCTGTDDDGNGKLDKGDPDDRTDCGEVNTKVFDQSPGSQFTHGAIAATSVPSGTKSGYQEIRVRDTAGKIIYSDRRCISITQ